MSDDLPLVSVLLPARNEATHLAACLEAVLAQDYPRDRLELIVIDGSSEDGTPGIVRSLAERDARVRLADNPRRIVPTALNIGLRLARGEVIARVDGHTRIARDYVRAGVETLRRTGADNVGGPMRAVGGGWFGDAVALATSSRFGIGSYFHFGTVEREVDTVYLGMWPRAVFERVGLFDEEFVRNQDDEFNYRLRKLGGRIVLTPAMRSSYQNRQSPRRLLRQYYQYGFWKVRVLQEHPRQMSWRHFMPPAFVASAALLALSAPFVPYAGGAAAAVVGAYAASILAVAAVNAGRRGWGAWLGAALAFASIHVAWGAGFLSGLVRFVGRWGKSERRPPSLGAPGSGVAAAAGHAEENAAEAARRRV